MATGYDNRQGGRSTFAFKPASPSQSPMAQPQGRGIQLQGGNTSIAGGIAAASNGITAPGPDANQIGGLLDELLSPMIERQKKAQFVKGMVDQMSAVAGEEIRVNSKNPINKIFGPSSYEEGAIFYATKDAVNKWQTNMMADMDNLKRLPPDQLSKVIASSFEQMATGDSFTDTSVQAALIEASGPITGAIAKERYKWQQGEALRTWSDAAASNADAFQAQMVSLASTADPSDGGNIAANGAFNNFRANLMKPEGMDDETYKKGLMGFYRHAAQSGNGYAVTALKGSGFLDLLTDEELVRLEDAEQKYGNRSLGRAATKYAEELDRLNFAMEFGKISSTEGMAQLAAINEKIKGETGFDQDLFDYKDVTGVGKTIWSALHTQLNRQEDRKWQLEDAARREQFELEKTEKEAADEAAQIQMAYGTGRIKTAMAAGIGAAGNFDVLAQADFAAGNWTNMLRAYNNDQWVSSLVRDQVQAQITNSVGQEYNKDFEQGYQKFTQLNKAKPAVAMAYYGDLYAPMLAYERLVTTNRVSPSQAFARAFNNPAAYAATPDLTKEAKKKVEDWINDNRGRGWVVGSIVGRGGLTTSGKSALTAAMSRQLGVMMKNTDMPVEALIPNMYEDLKASGAYEDYGRLGWGNAPGTEPLSKLLNIQQDEADEVVQKVIDRELKATGFSDGIKGDNFDIRRIRGPQGQAMVSVTPYDDEDGAGATVVIGIDKFKADADVMRAGRVARGRAPREATNAYKQNIYRRIPGESGQDRIARINREVRERNAVTPAGPLTEFRR